MLDKSTERGSMQPSVKKDPVVIEIVDDDEDGELCESSLKSHSSSEISKSVIHDEPKVLIEIGGKRVEPEACSSKVKEKRRCPP